MDQQDMITGTAPLMLIPKWVFTTEEEHYVFELLEYKNKVDQDVPKKTIK